MAATSAPLASAASKKSNKKPAMRSRAHPPVSEMVISAIKALDEKKGSSLQSIKKYIAGHYLCDLEKQAVSIRNFLNSAVQNKTLIRTRGIGASGSFKLGGSGKKKIDDAITEKSGKNTSSSKSPVEKTGKSSKTKSKTPKTKKTAKQLAKN